MIKKGSYWHGLIVGLPGGFSFGFLFSLGIDGGTSGRTNVLIYFSAFVICALVTVLLGAVIERLPEKSTPRFSRPIKRQRNAYCSFCRKAYPDTGPLVEGPGPDVFICGACVDLCRGMIDQEIARKAATLTPEPVCDPVERLGEKKNQANPPPGSD